MKIENIPVEETLEKIKRQIDAEGRNLPPALSASLELLLTLVALLLNRLGLDSRNSSKPPSSDPNREKRRKNGNGNPPGGQQGHAGNHRELIDDPDHVKVKTQYAAGVKIHSVYMSNFQLLPYQRIEEHFRDQFGIPLSAGSIYNFNKEAYDKLAPFPCR